MRSRVQSMSRTLTSSSAPICTSSDGCEMRPHDMSVMCSRPSTPPRSMNAPKSVMFLTTPLRTWSFCSSFMSFSRFPARSFSRITRRSEEHTSELQSPCNLVCRLLLEKKNDNRQRPYVFLGGMQHADPVYMLAQSDVIHAHHLHHIFDTRHETRYARAGKLRAPALTYD